MSLELAENNEIPDIWSKCTIFLHPEDPLFEQYVFPTMCAECGIKVTNLSNTDAGNCATFECGANYNPERFKKFIVYVKAYRNHTTEILFY